MHVVDRGGQGEICLDAASDGAGRTWLTVTAMVALAPYSVTLAIDTSAGVTHAVWQSVSGDRRVVSSAWLDNELHLATSRIAGSAVV